MRVNFYKIFGLLILSSSCAGPFNLFGPVFEQGRKHPLGETPITDRANLKPLPFSRFSKKIAAISPPIANNTLLRFSPEQQNWHTPTSFRSNIFDPYGIGENFEIRILLDGHDITNQVSSKWKLNISSDQKHLEIIFPMVSFNPLSPNDIRVIYKRSELSFPYMGEFPKPKCPISEKWEQKNHPDIYKHRWILNTSDKLSKRANINPGLLAGLIAQESNFDPRAVSRAGAIGLTQVTDVASIVVTNDYKHWPKSHFRTQELSYLELLFNVNSKILNSKNEWRLDVDKSIEGGVYYLKYLVDYWTKFNNELSMFTTSKELRKRQYIINNHLEELILASYHSGPSRIKKSLLVFGERWKTDPEIVEAHKYTGKVISYCQDYYQLKDIKNKSNENNRHIKKPRIRARYISSI